ncbi:hypothetical protein LMG22037_06442 [Paraburkholderia phenoliruptrix]|uniref:Uncharacterized protein n=1 Tax=Paraburkholderia phenoliruptrix TaxID=252970 RepID=A0A6J5CLU8_9BURK|nr:hypothetical protein [Paraburkholderia phenoliruptrix]CAB3741006.1 hypothetical protein LMG22037_06442 [Paraburkholderia phenoliruptrix]
MTKANRRKRRRQSMPPYESSEQLRARLKAFALATRQKGTAMSVALHELQTQREATIQKLLEEGESIAADAAPVEAGEWLQRGRIFGVEAGGQRYFARYQFDDHDEPRPVIRDILAEYGPAHDPWAIATWFHFPNGWIVTEGVPNRSRRKMRLTVPSLSSMPRAGFVERMRHNASLTDSPFHRA